MIRTDNSGNEAYAICLKSDGKDQQHNKRAVDDGYKVRE